MIDFAPSPSEDLEKTQRLPLLTPDALLDEALQREILAQVRIAELTRQNSEQAKEIVRSRATHIGTLERFQHTIVEWASTEEALFEACGALKDALSKVLEECHAEGLTLNCERAARDALEGSCDKLEHILSAPGFSAPTDYGAALAPEASLPRAPQTAQRLCRATPGNPGDRPVPVNENCPQLSCV
jgi:hypothetical protein